jgi:hypothetical protein
MQAKKPAAPKMPKATKKPAAPKMPKATKKPAAPKKAGVAEDLWAKYSKE